MTYATREEYRKAWDEASTTTPPIPLCVDLELCSLCGLSCPMCFWGDSGFSDAMKEKDATGAPLKRQMDTALAIRLIDEASDIGVPSMKFHGRGDGIHHKEYSKILQHARSKGTFLELLVNSHGNGGPDKVPGLMAAHKVMISLDSVRPATYAKMRPGGRLGRVTWLVEELLRQGHRNVWVRRVITDINRDEPFVAEARAIFGPQARISEHFAFNGRNSGRKSAVHHEDESQWERAYCGYPSQRMMVLVDGTVLPCCVDWRAEMPMGNVNEKGLLEIWQGIPYDTLRGDLMANDPQSKICRNCTSYQAYKRPERKYVADVEGEAAL